MYTPQETIKYENLVKASYKAVSRAFFDRNISLEVSIVAFFPIPAGVSPRMKKLMLDGLVLPTKRPDVDNLAKIILDGLNGVAYRDDAQVCCIHFKKKYSKTPETIVKIKETHLYEDN